jgi:hypothetical protein
MSSIMYYLTSTMQGKSSKIFSTALSSDPSSGKPAVASSQYHWP